MQTVNIDGKEMTVSKRRKDSIIDIPVAIKKRAQGLSYQEIADLQGVTKAAIYKALTPYRADLDSLHAYTSNRDTFADMGSARVYKGLLLKSPEQIAESEKLSSISACLKNLSDIQRLETGQSTSNVSIKVVDLSKYEGSE
jgi:predicted transcriptional regulator